MHDSKQWILFQCCWQGLQTSVWLAGPLAFPNREVSSMSEWRQTTAMSFEMTYRCVCSVSIMIFRKQLPAAHTIVESGVCDSSRLTGLKGLGLWSGSGHFPSQHVYAKWHLLSTQIMTSSVGEGAAQCLPSTWVDVFLMNISVELSFFFYSTVFSFFKKKNSE